MDTKLVISWLLVFILGIIDSNEGKPQESVSDQIRNLLEELAYSEKIADDKENTEIQVDDGVSDFSPVMETRQESSGDFTEPTIQLCFDYDYKTYKNIKIDRLVPYFREVVDGVEEIFQRSGLTVFGMPLHVRLKNLVRVGDIDLSQYGSGANQIDAVNEAYWTQAKLSNRLQDLQCDAVFLASNDKEWFDGAGVNGVAKASAMCSSYPYGLIYISKRPGRYQDTFIRVVAHELGHILGAYHVKDLAKITSIYGNLTPSECTGDCDLSSGYCIMDTVQKNLRNQNTYGSCTRSLVELNLSSLTNFCLL